MLYEQTSRTNLTKTTSSMSFGVSLDALAGSGVTDDEETKVTSSPDEAVKAGGVMQRLIHGTGPFPGCCWTSPSSLLTPVCSRAARNIACDYHAHLVSKAGSVIINKSPSPVFKWSGI